VLALFDKTAGSLRENLQRMNPAQVEAVHIGLLDLVEQCKNFGQIQLHAFAESFFDGDKLKDLDNCEQPKDAEALGEVPRDGQDMAKEIGIDMDKEEIPDEGDAFLAEGASSSALGADRSLSQP